jgi:hypothetical protein
VAVPAEAPMASHVLNHLGLCDAQVCSTGSSDDALEWLEANWPAGTRNGWSKAEGDAYAPVKCAALTDRTHYMFHC